MTKTTMHLSRWSKSYIQVWECCGNRWELIVSPMTVKDRQDWAPHCPTCHAKGQPFNPDKWDSVRQEDKLEILLKE